ncbi:MAG TPA: UV DNA damage repair endonuclease UvsE [Lentisphaeria bacterium]|nr:MAG: UV damage repair endonuclease UvsE [Lentisphaerae bacterium GWF2_38_69]HBM15651.1 UV DNA damage repair endonuclease UvsE [Lentisphaeria bacterium]
MKIGYPCINRSIGCTANTTFRLASYSEAIMIEKITNNLNCLKKILEYNVRHNLLFFRISSDLIPFASHPVCSFAWQDYFREKFTEIGNFIKAHEIRISMHPDQFVLINSPNEEIVRKSILELKYHCHILNLMNLDNSAKVQIHVGGVYGDKESAINRFINNYNILPKLIKSRLVIENDERLYSLKDCLDISEKTSVPILFDSFHHSCLNNGENAREAITIVQKTWETDDGILMVDYSSQEPGEKKGKHAEHIDIENFKKLIDDTNNLDFDIMLEIKNKEKSALEALKLINKCSRL